MHTYVWLCSHSFYRFPGNKDCYKVFKQTKNRVLRVFRGQELCERREGRPVSSPSLIVLTVFVDVNQHWRKRAYSSEVRSRVRVEVAVQGSTSLIVCTVSVDLKQQRRRNIYIYIKSNCHSAGTHTPATPTLPLPLWHRMTFVAKCFPLARMTNHCSRSAHERGKVLEDERFWLQGLCAGLA